MFDQEKLASIKAGLAGNKPVAPSLDGLDPQYLRTLHEQISALLPELSLKDINLENELLEQYQKTKLLMDAVAQDTEVPANQKAQVANAVISALQKLIDMQVDLKRDERLKKIEKALLDAIVVLPDDIKEAFFLEYEKIAMSQGATE